MFFVFFCTDIDPFMNWSQNVLFWEDCLHSVKTKINMWHTLNSKHILLVSYSIGHLTPSFPCWSAFILPVSSCGRPGPCSMSAARMVRNICSPWTKCHSSSIHLLRFISAVTYSPNTPLTDFILYRSVLSAAARYCSMLLEEGGLQQLELVHKHPQTHADVKLLAKSILESLQNHRARTGQPAPTQTSRRVPPQ